MLRAAFSAYRDSRFGEQEHLFEQRLDGGRVVFQRDHAANNILIPPSATEAQRNQIVALIPNTKRHRHFGSMQSSQALAQSVFGCIAVLGFLQCLSGVKTDGGRPAFGDNLDGVPELEKPLKTLNEPNPTSVDVWFGGLHRVAIECKFSEPDFGTCSRPKLKPSDPRYEQEHCDGTYVRQRGRLTAGALTELNISYWSYMEPLFGWSPAGEHRPCPLAATYQLARNVMAACIDNEGLVSTQGHALVIYDERNPAFRPGGKAEQQWQAATSALKHPDLLRRLSWQRFISQWPNEVPLVWLKEELRNKYGILPNA